jgi:hypothetical protein
MSRSNSLNDGLRRQRIQYVMDSYRLAGDEEVDCAVYLTDLLDCYTPAAIELAVVDILVTQWNHAPLRRGVVFLDQVRSRLDEWTESGVSTCIRPQQFRHITGLDPRLVFGDSATATSHCPH